MIYHVVMFFVHVNFNGIIRMGYTTIYVYLKSHWTLTRFFPLSIYFNVCSNSYSNIHKGPRDYFLFLVVSLAWLFFDGIFRWVCRSRMHVKCLMKSPYRQQWDEICLNFMVCWDAIFPWKI